MRRNTRRLDLHSAIGGVLVLSATFCLSCGKQNRAPGTPSVPDGPSSGAKDSLCEFTSMATDPDGGDVCFRFDWGDGDTSDWSGWVKSGQPGGTSHAWHSSGTFAVRAQAKDPGDSVSAWSDARQLNVAMSWRRTYGGSFGDWGYSVKQTSDGGYVVAGSAYPDITSPDNVLLVKVDSSGRKIWDKMYGGPSSDGSMSITQTTDGGYIVVGYTWRDSEDQDVWLLKTDADGDSLWTRTFGGVRSDRGTSVQQTFDGGYIIAGYTYSFGAGDADVWLVKTDDHGDTAWTRTFGGAGYDIGAAVQQTSDGGYIIAGTTESYGAGDWDIWLLKTDASGNRVWDRPYGGPRTEEGASVQQTSDGGYVVAGRTSSYGAGDYDMWLARTDSSGNMVWDKTFGGADLEAAAAVQQTTDGGYIIAGSTYSYGAGNRDVWLVKTDVSGNRVWDRTFGGKKYDEGGSVRQTFDGGYIVVGYTYSLFEGSGPYLYLVKTGADGE